MKAHKWSQKNTVRRMIWLGCVVLAFVLGIMVQKLGYPHQLREVLFHQTEQSLPNVETQDDFQDTAQAVVPVPVVDQDLLRQALTVDPARVSLNHERFNEDTKRSYRFLTTGHAYGFPDGNASRPAATWVDFLPLLDEVEPDLLLFTGDIVKASTTVNFEHFEKVGLEGLQIPVFNAVGNHDVENRLLYEKRYGDTFYTLRYGPAQFVVLDTELDGCQIVETQKAFLEAAIAQALDDSQVSSIFVFMHRALFLDHETLQVLFESGNVAAAPNAQECYLEHNFEDILTEILSPSANQKPVYVIAGDVGAWCGNLSPFYDEFPDSNVTLLAAGLGDCEEDAILQVDFDESSVEVSFYSLTGQIINKFQQYNLAYYRAIAAGDQ